ncbi:MAG: 2-dehydro-3-deoxygalactonokinase [Bacillota bacterium]|nr:2-dehydro-3-deoxygalactonokinase [Bacillota bacterium]
MKYVITVDTGTTNTRAILWQDSQILARDFQPVGVRDTAISGSKDKLKNGIHQAIENVLHDSKVTSHEDVVLLGSGMITSDVGLVEVPHLNAPAGFDELAQGMVEKVIPEVFDQPFWFVPGIKTNGSNTDPRKVTDMDVMRGEEVEVIGAISKLDIQRNAIIILPGSHTKIIKVDGKHRILGSITSMTGELLDMITKDSIIADSVEGKFADSLEEQPLLLGSQTTKIHGLGQAAFSSRLLGMFTPYTRNQIANYVLGAVLANDVQAIKNTTAFPIAPDDKIYILGKEMLRDALKLVIDDDSEIRQEVITDNFAHLSATGTIELATARGLLKQRAVR